MKDTIKTTLEWIGILTLVVLVWQGLEILVYGEIKGDTVDSIVGLILALSLYVNYKNFEKKPPKEYLVWLSNDEHLKIKMKEEDKSYVHDITLINKFVTKNYKPQAHEIIKLNDLEEINL